MIINQIKKQLRESITTTPEKQAVFFKTGIGHYAEHDQFLGLSVPILRQFAKQYKNLGLEDNQLLLQSPFNEERLLALFILVDQYKHANSHEKDLIFEFYKANMHRVNNWNLVDSSAHLIIGAHLLNQDKQLLVELSQSSLLWERRISMVATWYFIRNNQLEYTFKIAKLLLDDKEDLIHKAVGWMLREAGKKDEASLHAFLEAHSKTMPRTMLRYAIEKFSEEKRKSYLQKS